MTTTLIEFQIAADPPARLDKALFRDAPAQAELSRTYLTRLILAGAVRINQAPQNNPKAKVMEGAQVQIELPCAAELDLTPENIPLRVVYEDDALIVIDKPAGMVVHPAPGSPTGTLVHALLHHCADSLSGIGGEKRPGIVHRIDKDTSGLLVVAKSDKAHHGLAKQFELHKVERAYRAICYGVPDANEPRLRGVRGVNFEAGNVMKITTHLARHRTDRQRQAVFFEGGRHAVTRARLLESYGRPATLSLIECQLETGRTHQIRVHMKYLGHPLFNDERYGGDKILKGTTFTKYKQFIINCFKACPRHALHAKSLGFTHPKTGEQHRYESVLPEDMQEVIRKFDSYTSAVEPHKDEEE